MAVLWFTPRVPGRPDVAPSHVQGRCPANARLESDKRVDGVLTARCIRRRLERLETEKPIFVNLRDKEDLDGFRLTSSSEPVGEGPINRSGERESG
jgi:hypothetical protein